MTSEQRAIDLPSFPGFSGGLRSLRNLGTDEIPMLESSEYELLMSRAQEAPPLVDVVPLTEVIRERTAPTELLSEEDADLTALERYYRKQQAGLWIVVSGLLAAAGWTTYDYVLPMQASLHTRNAENLRLEARNIDSNRIVAGLSGDVAALEAERDALTARLERRELGLIELQDSSGALTEKLGDEIARGELFVRVTDTGLALDIVDEVLFEADTSNLSREGKKLLARIGHALGEHKEPRIRIGGHTDGAGLNRKQAENFDSPWDLSSQRAGRVAHFLEKRGKIEGRRLQAVGFGAHQPVASNENPRGRRRNRRIELALSPKPVR
jgi:chemotaxis protein MotB